MRYGNFGFHKTRGISWLAGELLASQIGLCSVELLVIENVKDPDTDRYQVVDSDWLRAGRFSAPVHTGPGAHPAPYTVGTGFLSRG